MQYRKRENQHAAREPVRIRILESFNVIVNLYRHHAGLVRDVSADHQHNAEFADRMSKAENGGGNEAGSRQWQNDAEKNIQRIGAQGGSNFQRPLADRLKAFCNGCTTKGIEYKTGGDDQARKGKRQQSQPSLG